MARDIDSLFGIDLRPSAMTNIRSEGTLVVLGRR